MHTSQTGSSCHECSRNGAKRRKRAELKEENPVFLADQLRQNLAIVGRLEPKELEALEQAIGSVDFADDGDGSGFDSEYVTDAEREFTKRHRIAMDAIYKESDFALFVEPVGEEFSQLQARLKNLVSRAALIPAHDMDAFCFSGYYAAVHDDKHTGYLGQLMVIGRNSGHRLYSEPGEVSLAPRAGDIIVLNTRERHGLLPKRGLSVQKCQAKPLIFFALPFNEPEAIAENA